MSALLKVEDWKCYFPVKSGLWQRTKSYLKAVNGVHLKVAAGEIVSIVGESGCGKSTLGNSLLGLVKPTGGRLWLNGTLIDREKVSAWKPFRRDFQIIFQDPYSSLNPRHTVFEILSEPLLHYRLCSKKDAKVKSIELLEKVGLSADYIDRFPHAFSGGQRQRLGIARILGLKPKLIICDEIVSALDVSVQAQIIQLLLKLKKEYDLSLIFIAHDLSLVKAISDRVYVMYLGKIVEWGGQELFTHPKHPYTQSLIQSIPTLDRSKRPVPLQGEVPSLSQLPKGCSFYGRCPNKLEKCKESEPSIVSGKEPYSCFNPLES